MIAAAITVVLAGQFGGSPADNFLVDGDRAFFFLPPVVVSQGEWRGSNWSSDGRWLVVVSEDARMKPSDWEKALVGQSITPPTPALNIDVYNALTSSVKRVWSSDVAGRSTVQVEFFPASDVSIVHVVSADSTNVIKVTAGTSKAELLETVQGRAFGWVDPKGRYIASLTDSATSVRFIAPSGALLPRIMLAPHSDVFWTADGELVSAGNEDYIVIQPQGGQGVMRSGKPVRSFVPDGIASIDRVWGRSVTMKIPYMEGEIRSVLVSIGDGKPIVLAVNAQAHESSEGGVFFTREGINYVRPMVDLPRSVFEEALARAGRTDVMRKLNNIGKALIMYAGDNDGKFPTQEELGSGAANGYLGDTTLLDGFVYTGSMRGSNPAETPFGYMPCPGGRAVVYQDGHVVFVPDR